MQPGRANFPLRLNFDSTAFQTDRSQSPERQLKRLMIAEASQQVFMETRRQLTESQRKQTMGAARAPIYTDLAERLNAVAQQLATPRTLTGAGALDLGPGSGNALTGVDVNAPLNTQSFGQPITAGTVELSIRVNGGPATARSVTIDPGQSLATTLQQFSNLTVGGSNPISAFVEDGQVVFQLDSSSGSSVGLSITGGTSNFLEAVSNAGRASEETFTANGSVGTAPGTLFRNLSVSYNGQTVNVSGLTTNNPLLTAGQRASQLAAKINDALAAGGLAQNGLQAVGLANGKLQFTGQNASQPTNPSLGATITESGGGQTLGFAAGFSSRGTLLGSAYLSGPDAPLSQLSRLGFAPVDGRFKVTINGSPLTIDASLSLSAVLKDISTSTAGVSASYDPSTRRVSLTQQSASPRPIDVQDTSGNFFSTLQLARSEGGAQGAIASLEPTARALADVLGALEQSTVKGGPFPEEPPLLRDLRDAIGGLFRPSRDGELRTLGDLGFSVKNGELQVDAARQAELAAQDPAGVLGAVAAIAARQITPLARAGGQALQDELARTPLELRLAEQNVHARAELGRLQDRQALLVHQQAALESAHKSLERQRERIEEQEKRFGEPKVHVPPRHEDLIKPLFDDKLLSRPLTERPGLAQPEPPSPGLPAGPPGDPPAGILSFGLNAQASRPT